MISSRVHPLKIFFGLLVLASPFFAPSLAFAAPRIYLLNPSPLVCGEKPQISLSGGAANKPIEWQWNNSIETFPKPAGTWTTLGSPIYKTDSSGNNPMINFGTTIDEDWPASTGYWIKARVDGVEASNVVYYGVNCGTIRTNKVSYVCGDKIAIDSLQNLIPNTSGKFRWSNGSVTSIWSGITFRTDSRGFVVSGGPFPDANGIISTFSNFWPMRDGYWVEAIIQRGIDSFGQPIYVTATNRTSFAVYCPIKPDLYISSGCSSGKGYAHLSWSTIPDAETYTLYRCTGPGCLPTDAQSIWSDRGVYVHDDSNLADGTYNYTMKAAKGSLVSARSDVKTAAISCGSTPTCPGQACTSSGVNSYRCSASGREQCQQSGSLYCWTANACPRGQSCTGSGSCTPIATCPGASCTSTEKDTYRCSASGREQCQQSGSLYCWSANACPADQSCTGSGVCGGGQCTELTFNSSTSGFSPTTVAPGGQITVKCDYGVATDATWPIINGQACFGWTHFDGSVAYFNCTAPSSSRSYSVACHQDSSATSPPNVCTADNSLGTLTVTGPPPPACPNDENYGGNCSTDGYIASCGLTHYYRCEWNTTADRLCYKLYRCAADQMCSSTERRCVPRPPTPAPESCPNGTCTSAGATQCSGSQKRTCNEEDKDNNGTKALCWSSPVNCPVGQTCSGSSCVLTSKPDLVISNKSKTPAAPKSEDEISFNATVRNSGAAVSPTSKTLFHLDIDNNGSWDLTRKISTNALAIGGTEQKTLTDFWAATVGTHKYEFCADTDGVVGESDESNNCAGETFHVIQRPPEGGPCDISFPDNRFHVCYFDGKGAPVNTSETLVQENESPLAAPEAFISARNNAIVHDWGTGQVGATTKSDNVSAVWRGKINFQPGKYTFHVNSDDGVRVLIKPQDEPATSIINDWEPTAPIFNKTAGPYTLAGPTDIRLRWFENGGGAFVKLWWDYEPLPLTNDAKLISLNAPTLLEVGETQAVSVVMQNCRSDDNCSNLNTWTTADYFLKSMHPGDTLAKNVWGVVRRSLTADVIPGNNGTFTFNITAPSLGKFNAAQNNDGDINGDGNKDCELAGESDMDCDFMWRMKARNAPPFGEYAALGTIRVHKGGGGDETSVDIVKPRQEVDNGIVNNPLEDGYMPVELEWTYFSTVHSQVQYKVELMKDDGSCAGVDFEESCLNAVEGFTGAEDNGKDISSSSLTKDIRLKKNSDYKWRVRAYAVASSLDPTEYGISDEATFSTGDGGVGPQCGARGQPCCDLGGDNICNNPSQDECNIVSDPSDPTYQECVECGGLDQICCNLGDPGGNNCDVGGGNCNLDATDVDNYQYCRPECADGINNDPGEDILTDCADPQCHTGGILSNSCDKTIDDESGGGVGGSGFKLIHLFKNKDDQPASPDFRAFCHPWGNSSCPRPHFGYDLHEESDANATEIKIIPDNPGAFNASFVTVSVTDVQEDNIRNSSVDCPSGVESPCADGLGDGPTDLLRDRKLLFHFDDSPADHVDFTKDFILQGETVEFKVTRQGAPEGRYIITLEAVSQDGERATDYILYINGRSTPGYDI